MKKSLVFLGSVLFLAACTGGGGGGSAGGVGPLGGPINPSQAPQNPASKETIKQFFAETKVIRKLIPSEEALFPEVMWGDYVSKVDEESRLRAEARLNDQGREFLARIKASCDLSPIKKEISGEAEKAKTGETVTAKLSQSSSGSGCEYVSSKQSESTTKVLERSSSIETGETVDRTVKEGSETFSEEILNVQVVAGGAYRSNKSNSRSKSDYEYRYQRVAPDKYKYLSKHSSASVWSAEIVLSNGMRILSSSQSSSVSQNRLDDNKAEISTSVSLSLHKISTPFGEIWMGREYKDGEEIGFYLNGEKLSKEEEQELLGFE